MRNKLECVFLFLGLLLIPATGQAQPEQHQDVWVFGTEAGLDFRTVPPTGFRTSIRQLEGCASVCDERGDLLFYSDGSVIFNRNGQVMPNGVLFPGVSTSHMYSTTQACVIVPFPGDDSRFYVFSLESYTFPGALYYSVVDIALNNGLGDVPPGQKGLPVASGLSEKMTAVSGDNCNIWLITHARTYNSFQAFEIRPGGINTVPVVSGNANPGGYQYGEISVSPDRRKIASALHGASANDRVGLELSEFDPATGMVSNTTELDTGAEYWSVGFSPGNSKLYGSAENLNESANAGIPRKWFQYDLSLPSVNAIINSRQLINILDTTSIARGIKTGPDGYVYLSVSNNPVLHRILDPEKPGLACKFRYRDVLLAAGSQTGANLPNHIAYTIPKDTFYSEDPLRFTCTADSMMLQADSPGRNYLWTDGMKGRRKVIHGQGTYRVGYQDRCDYYIKTWVITQSPFPRPGKNGFSCEGQRQGRATVVPSDGDHSAYRYSWSDPDGLIFRDTVSATGDGAEGLNPGSYTVKVLRDDGCDTVLEISIGSLPLPVSVFLADSIVCVNEPVWLENLSYASSYFWSFGDGSTSATGSPEHVYERPGTYLITLVAESIEGCRDTSRHTVVVAGFELQLSASDTLVDLNRMVTLETAGSGDYEILSWAPVEIFPEQAARRQHVNVDDTRYYSVTGRSLISGCMDSAGVTVKVNPIFFIPDAFTPNGDGKNDYFRPYFLGGKGQILSLRIFDRWGKQVWEMGAGSVNGWDGNINGKPAGTGVYFFTAEIETPKEKVYRKGDLTLIR